MEYKVKVVFKKEELSEKEKITRIKQFQKAFVTSAVSYLSDINNVSSMKKVNG